jgi:hypothetical protein
MHTVSTNHSHVVVCWHANACRTQAKEPAHFANPAAVSSSATTMTMTVGVSLLAVGGAVAFYIGWLLLYILGLWANGSTW